MKTAADKDWLQTYLDLRVPQFREMTSDSGRKASHPEHALYRIIQPTGLMYGQSIGSGLPLVWTDRDRMRVLLAESLISSSLLFYDQPIQSDMALWQVINRTLESIGNFYNSIFPELSTPTKTIFGKKKSPIELAQRVMEKRVDLTQANQHSFWATFFHNSLLFLDVYIFGQWIHTNADKIVSDFFRYEREELRFSVVKVIAAAAHANREIAFEERKLFEYFLDSTRLSPRRKREALAIFAEGIALEDINLPSENSWILKKFFLELSILTIWSDKKVEQSELNFLRRLCHYFDFSDDDLENSMIAVEGFVLEHWPQLEYLQNKQDFEGVTEQFIRRVARITERNKTRLIHELQEHQEAMWLLRKARTTELSPDEKEEVRLEMIEILRTIPNFNVVALPPNFLTLPILLKIMPRDLFFEGVMR